MQRYQNTSGVYAVVYEVVNEASFGCPPPGARGALYRAIDALRASAAPREHVRLVEEMSVALHRMDAGRLDTQFEAEQAREKLQELGSRWLQVPITALH